jgi:hypothetical protein
LPPYTSPLTKNEVIKLLSWLGWLEIVLGVIVLAKQMDAVLLESTNECREKGQLCSQSLVVFFIADV